MPFTIMVTRDYDHMSEFAAALVEKDLSRIIKQKNRCVLGLATGRSPGGLYKHLAKAANNDRLDVSKIRTFNLDEYIGLPGQNAQQRANHPESYSFYMIRDFFGLLRGKLAETNLPWGTLVEQEKFVKALNKDRADWFYQGRKEGNEGKAIIIHAKARNKYLAWVREEIINGYSQMIKKTGGVDLQVIGVGSRGHVAFHEAGIPFRGNKVLLVKLDESTVENAVADGHFDSVRDCPLFAVSMGVELIYRAPTVVLLASGERKIHAVTESVLGPIGPDLPLSYSQKYAAQGGNLIYVLDRVAATDLLKRRKELKVRGYQLKDLSRKKARIMVSELAFICDPVTGYMM